MYEVAQLGTGKHFGELALTTNKPRAATIKCLTNTHLLVISKDDYQKVLMRFEEANLSKFVDFLKNMPHFATWSKNSLSRLTYYMPKKVFYRNQIVYKEGEKCTHVYVVLEGEFEITKKMRPLANEQNLLNRYLGPMKESTEMNLRIDKHMIKHHETLP